MELHLYYAVIVLAAVAAFYKFVVYPTFLSPLSKVPNAHWSSGFCPIWIHCVKRTKQENREVYRLHMEKEPAVRVAPNLVSVNCFEDGLKRIYHGGFPKPDMYFNGFAVYGYEPFLVS